MRETVVMFKHKVERYIATVHGQRPASAHPAPQRRGNRENNEPKTTVTLNCRFFGTKKNDATVLSENGFCDRYARLQKHDWQKDSLRDRFARLQKLDFSNFVYKLG